MMHLLSLIERHLRIHGIAATRFGRDAMRDPRFVFDLRNGREPGASTVRRVLDYLGRPDGAGSTTGADRC